MSREDRAPSFQFYPRDFLSDAAVVCMTPEERGGYILLLCHAWMSDEPGILTDDDTILAALSGLGERWSDCRSAIAKAFAHRSLNGRSIWVQKRMTIERGAQKARRENAAKGARVTNEKRWGSVAGRQFSESQAISPASASASASALPAEDNPTTTTSLSHDHAPAANPDAVPAGGGGDSLSLGGESTPEPVLEPDLGAERERQLAELREWTEAGCPPRAPKPLPARRTPDYPLAATMAGIGARLLKARSA